MRFARLSNILLIKKGIFLNNLFAKIILFGLVFKDQSPKTKIKKNIVSAISVLVYTVSLVTKGRFRKMLNV